MKIKEEGTLFLFLFLILLIISAFVFKYMMARELDHYKEHIKTNIEQDLCHTQKGRNSIDTLIQGIN
jgi:hypothetical protein